MNHLAYPQLPNQEFKCSFDDFLDLFDSEAFEIMNKPDTLTGLAPITMLTAPNDFWREAHRQSQASRQDEEHAAFLLRAVQPDAKFIGLFRDPTERLYRWMFGRMESKSLILYWLESFHIRLYSDWQFFNKKTNKTEFHELVVNAVTIFQTCLEENSLWPCLYEYMMVE